MDGGYVSFREGNSFELSKFMEVLLEDDFPDFNFP